MSVFKFVFIIRKHILQPDIKVNDNTCVTIIRQMVSLCMYRVVMHWVVTSLQLEKRYCKQGTCLVQCNAVEAPRAHTMKKVRRNGTAATSAPISSSRSSAKRLQFQALQLIINNTADALPDSGRCRVDTSMQWPRTIVTPLDKIPPFERMRGLPRVPLPSFSFSSVCFPLMANALRVPRCGRRDRGQRTRSLRPSVTLSLVCQGRGPHDEQHAVVSDASRQSVLHNRARAVCCLNALLKSVCDQSWRPSPVAATRRVRRCYSVIRSERDETFWTASGSRKRNNTPLVVDGVVEPSLPPYNASWTAERKRQ